MILRLTTVYGDDVLVNTKYIVLMSLCDHITIGDDETPATEIVMAFMDYKRPLIVRESMSEIETVINGD